ncbi:MAG TPA: hypothetical protein VJ625_02045 [Propionibacteriaceae bacterium]|nr:hypothetical protein [Propionibacteriaceae bacterium]
MARSPGVIYRRDGLLHLESRYRAGLLLAAFAGLRLAEVCRLKVSDIDFMRGIVNANTRMTR